MSEYEELYRKMEAAISAQSTSDFEFANSISEPFFFCVLSQLGECHMFGHKKYQGADGVFLPNRRPFFVDVKFDTGVSRRNPQYNGMNIFAEITANAMPSSWLGAYHLKGGIGMINWYRKEAFLYDPGSVQKIFELWYQRKLKAVSSSIGTVGILVPVDNEEAVGRKEAQVIFKFDEKGADRIK